MYRKKILCVGLVCIDLIQMCKEYPLEDSDQRSIDHRWQRGGNASNNCTVLSKCGEECEFFGTMCEDFMADYAKQDFKYHNICLKNVVTYNDVESPFSSVITNSKNGSRTIIHSNKNLPELDIEDFKKLDLSQYSWIHFEGRNPKQVNLMMECITEWNTCNQAIKTSIEFEKPKEGLETLLHLADVVFIGKDFASGQGCQNKFEALEKNVSFIKPRSTIVVAWGELGAIAQTVDGEVVESPAFISENVVDTLGAGDTFVAVTILCLSKEFSLRDSITSGCRVAGAKVTAKGFSAIHSGLLTTSYFS